MARPSRKRNAPASDTRTRTKRSAFNRAYASSYKTKPASKVLGANGTRGAKLNYGDQLGSTILVLNKWDRTYRGNGMFDPDYSLGGHQPYGFDQYMSLFKNFYVKGSTIKVNAFVNQGSGTPNYSDVMAYVWSDTESGTPSAANDLIERCMANSGKFWRVPAQYGPDITKTVRSTTKKELSRGMEDSTTKGTVAADPSAVWYWHVVLLNDGAADKTITLTTDIEYDSVFSGEANISGS